MVQTSHSQVVPGCLIAVAAEPQEGGRREAAAVSSGRGRCCGGQTPSLQPSKWMPRAGEKA